MTINYQTPESLMLVAIGAVILLAVLWIVFMALYFGARRRTEQAVREAQYTWHIEQMDALRREAKSEASADALQQLESWKRQDLELIKAQEVEAARRDADLQIKEWKDAYTKTIRQDAIQKSQSVVAGKVTEHFVPFLPDFAFNPRDARFLGSPVDFIVFDGLDEGQLKRVVFIEVKTNSATLNQRERQVKAAIQEGRVEYCLVRHHLASLTTGFEGAQVNSASSTRLNGVGGT